VDDRPAYTVCRQVKGSADRCRRHCGVSSLDAMKRLLFLQLGCLAVVLAVGLYIHSALIKRFNPFTADPVKALHFAILV